MEDWTLAYNLLLMGSKVIFFSSVLTRSPFKSSGNSPVCSDSFTNLVRSSIMDGRTFFSSSVGITSASQVFVGEAKAIFTTSSQLTSQQFSRTPGIVQCSVSISGDPRFCSINLDLMLVILVVKKSLKLSASSWFMKPGGSGGSLPLPSRLSHTLNTCLVFLLCSWNILR